MSLWEKLRAEIVNTPALEARYATTRTEVLARRMATPNFSHDCTADTLLASIGERIDL